MASFRSCQAEGTLHSDPLFNFNFNFNFNLKVKDDPLYAEFFQMLAMGVPATVVQMKMEQKAEEDDLEVGAAVEQREGRVGAAVEQREGGCRQKAEQKAEQKEPLRVRASL